MGLKLLVEHRHRVGSDALAQLGQLGVEPEIVSGVGCKVSQALHCKATLYGTVAFLAFCWLNIKSLEQDVFENKKCPNQHLQTKGKQQ